MRTRVALPVLLALAAGCAVGPDYERPEIQPPAEFRSQIEAPESASLADLAWWEIYREPVLQELIHEALENSFDLRTAAARVEQARAQVGVTRSEMFPQLGYQGAAQRGRQFTGLTADNQTFNAFLGAFSVAWEIDVWGRIRRASEAALADMLATEEFRRAVVQTLVTDVATAYFDLLELDLELEIARRTTLSFEDTLSLFERQYAGGVGNKLETSRALAALAQTAAAIPALEAQIVAKENQLATLLGRYPGPIPRGAPLVEQALPEDAPPGLPSTLLERRPDIRQAEQTIAATNALVGVAVANFFPRIGLTALYGGQSQDLDNVVKGPGNIWAIAGQLAGPIFRGGALLEGYRGQKAIFEQARYQWVQTILIALGEVSNALTAQQKLALVRADQAVAVGALREAVRLATLRYTGGLASYFEVLEAQQQLFPAENELARTTRDQLLATVQLYKALGGGWSADDFTPPGWFEFTQVCREPEPHTSIQPN
jgi:multidrug efflux system outer membrane protein